MWIVQTGHCELTIYGPVIIIWRLSNIPVKEKNFAAGNPLTIVAVEAAGSSERISQACREVYAQIQDVLQEKMVCSGMPHAEAAEQAGLILASIEGCIILSRIYRTTDPLRTLAA